MSGCHPLRTRAVVLGPAAAAMWNPRAYLLADVVDADLEVCDCDHVRDVHTDRGACVAAHGCDCTEWRPV